MIKSSSFTFLPPPEIFMINLAELFLFLKQDKGENKLTRVEIVSNI